MPDHKEPPETVVMTISEGLRQILIAKEQDLGLTREEAEAKVASLMGKPIPGA